MTWRGLLRGEVRKLVTTRMPWAFLAVLAILAVLNAIAVIYGSDADGSKTFVSTSADQRSLMAFANNAMMGASLFGAIAAAREYGHATVVPMFLTEPRRHRAMLAQLAAVMLTGAAVRNVGGAVTATFLILMVLPPLVVQLTSGAASWMPGTLTNVASGVATDVATPAAFLALTAWAVIPALLGLLSVHRRDVV